MFIDYRGSIYNINRMACIYPVRYGIDCAVVLETTAGKVHHLHCDDENDAESVMAQIVKGLEEGKSYIGISVKDGEEDA